MITSLNIKDLSNYTTSQLNFFFPDKNKIDEKTIEPFVEIALNKIDNCFKRVTLKHYFNGHEAIFNHLYSDHYVSYLWYLGNTIWSETKDKNICNKLYYLNKSLHALDCMYNTNLPDIFLIFHGAGTMLGKAIYSDYFVVLQGCTIGMNKGHYPTMQKGVALTAHSSLIGNCHVGNLVTLSSYTNIIDTNIKDNHVVYKDATGAINIKHTNNSYAQSFFNEPII